MTLPEVIEGVIVFAIAACLLYFLFTWIYNDATIEEMEDTLLAIRGKDKSYVSVCSIRDEYALYKEAMKQSKHAMNYENWLANRIIIEGDDE